MSNPIKSLRESHGFSQTYLATTLGVSRQMYIKYETGEVDPPISVIKKLCKLYNVSYGYLLDSSEYACEQTLTYNAKPKNIENQILEKLRMLSPNELSKIYSFIDFTIQEKSNDLISKGDKSALFEYAGKIHLSSEEVEDFRQDSLI